jgi:DNA repair protein RadC
LRELGPDKLDDRELVAILIPTGTRARPAAAIACDILVRFGSHAGLANQPLETLLEIKGLGDVKIRRIAAALELAPRLRARSPVKKSGKPGKLREKAVCFPSR